jgi:hypothetical protein
MSQHPTGSQGNAAHDNNNHNPSTMLGDSRELNSASPYLLTSLCFVRTSECDRVGGAMSSEPEQVEEDPILASCVSRNQHIFAELPGIYEYLRLPERFVP